MQKREKLFTALSELMKQQSQAQQSIIQNLR
jgi:hypothetical protein